MNDQSIKIAIAESSVIIRSGLNFALKRIPGLRIQSFEVPNMDLLSSSLRMHQPDILVVNPTFWGVSDINKLKTECCDKKLMCIALLTNPIDESILKHYDESIHLYDSVDTLKAKIDKLIASNDDELPVEDVNTLSLREKEILTCVVKGLTNKEIAQELFLSTHTVITHRRNITRKLEIHSTAGLTIYAIVNKLVELDDIKSVIE